MNHDVARARKEEREAAILALFSIPYTQIDGVPLVIRDEAADAIERNVRREERVSLTLEEQWQHGYDTAIHEATLVLRSIKPLPDVAPHAIPQLLALAALEALGGSDDA